MCAVPGPAQGADPGDAAVSVRAAGPLPARAVPAAGGRQSLIRRDHPVRRGRGPAGGFLGQPQSTCRRWAGRAVCRSVCLRARRFPGERTVHNGRERSVSERARRLLPLRKGLRAAQNAFAEPHPGAGRKKYAEKAGFLSQRTTREKLLAYLSAQARRAGSASFRIPFDRQQLADYLSVNRSAMSAELSNMQRDGLLRTDRSCFTLCQPEDTP